VGRRRCNGWGAVRQRLPGGSVADLLPGDDGQGGVDGVEHRIALGDITEARMVVAGL